MKQIFLSKKNKNNKLIFHSKLRKLNCWKQNKKYHLKIERHWITLPDNIGREHVAWCAPKTDTSWRHHTLFHSKKQSNLKMNRVCSLTTLTSAPPHVPVLLCISATVAGSRHGSRRGTGGSSPCSRRRRQHHRRSTLTTEFRRWKLVRSRKRRCRDNRLQLTKPRMKRTRLFFFFVFIFGASRIKGKVLEGFIRKQKLQSL